MRELRFTETYDAIEIDEIEANMEQAKINVFKIDDKVHPYPWRFDVIYKGVIHKYRGTSNYCETKRQATARAVWRKRWLENGVAKYQ